MSLEEAQKPKYVLTVKSTEYAIPQILYYVYRTYEGLEAHVKNLGEHQEVMWIEVIELKQNDLILDTIRNTK